jgi:hypothetical protein
VQTGVEVVFTIQPPLQPFFTGFPQECEEIIERKAIFRRRGDTDGMKAHWLRGEVAQLLGEEKAHWLRGEIAHID